MYRLSEKAVLFLPPETVEAEALQQIRNTASMGFIFKHVAVMPDCHYGKGATVGTVIATTGAVIPAAVGVDIGCGMIAVKTPLQRDALSDLAALRHRIERRVPMSAGRNNARVEPTAAPRVAQLEAMAGRDYAQIHSAWRLQLGTLGGGNHFIELATDQDGAGWAALHSGCLGGRTHSTELAPAEAGAVWATLHSGSRGVGNKIGTMYIRRAQDEVKKKRE